MLSLKEQDKVEGSGILLDMSEGMTFCAKDVAMLMIILSDNTATNIRRQFLPDLMIWELRHLVERTLRTCG